MKLNPIVPILIAVFAFATVQGRTEEYFSLPKVIQAQLQSGEVVPLLRQPRETGKIDKRFVTMAKLMAGTRSEIWAVINDKDNAEKFLEGVLESRIVRKNGNEVIVEQKTEVGGPKGSYQYTLKYLLTPETRAEFSFVNGEIKNVAGAWWIFDGPDSDRKLVIYSLHIDPGVFAPQFVVKNGMKKTIPETILSTEREILRRQSERNPKPKVE